MRLLLCLTVTSSLSGPSILVSIVFSDILNSCLVYRVSGNKCRYVLLLRGHKAFIVGCRKYESDTPWELTAVRVGKAAAPKGKESLVTGTSCTRMVLRQTKSYFRCANKLWEPLSCFIQYKMADGQVRCQTSKIFWVIKHFLRDTFCSFAGIYAKIII
jgi:hypothetical protein